MTKSETPTKADIQGASSAEKRRARAHWAQFYQLRFLANGTVEAQARRGGSWGLLLTERQWSDTLAHWRACARVSPEVGEGYAPATYSR